MSSSNSTKWQCNVTDSGKGPVASLTCTTNGSTTTQVRIKGICYSPCPVGDSNKTGGPAIGDWFWDTYTSGSTTTTSWEQTWSRDLPMMKALGVNIIRVYCMLSKQLPDQYNADTVYTHQKFLDACYEQGMYVLIGFPLPDDFFISGETPSPSASWWQNNLQETVTALGSHPAVMGFTIANEVDNGSVSTYGPATQKSYWWSQVQAMAKIAKTAAPDKLIGIANHDDPGICKNCATEMADCTDIDFWGVNTYQPQSFSSVFGSDTVTPGYATLTGAALKPVILTEYGFPGTSRTTANTLYPEQIVSNSTTQQKVADLMNVMLPKAYAEQLNLGVFYFEFCDEWWDQAAYTIAPGASCPSATGDYAPAGGAGGSFTPPNTYTQYGGPIACGFPNYYWDVDGFGLYSISAGEGRTPSQPWNNSGNCPALPIDTRTARPSMIAAVTNFNGETMLSGFVTEINTNSSTGQVQVALNSDSYGRPPASNAPGSLTNYFYEPGNLSSAEEAALAGAKTSGAYVTVFLANDSRNITRVIAGS